MANKNIQKSPDKGHKHLYGDSIAAIIVNIILLYVFNNLLNWHIPYLKDNFAAVVWLFNLQILVTILFNFILLITGISRLKKLFEGISSALSVVVLLSIYFIFPFDFPGEWNGVAKILILLCAIATAIAVIVQLLTFLFKSENDR